MRVKTISARRGQYTPYDRQIQKTIRSGSRRNIIAYRTSNMRMTLDPEDVCNREKYTPLERCAPFQVTAYLPGA
jgi:hypothetical protein